MAGKVPNVESIAAPEITVEHLPLEAVGEKVGITLAHIIELGSWALKKAEPFLYIAWGIERELPHDRTRVIVESIDEC